MDDTETMLLVVATQINDLITMLDNMEPKLETRDRVRAMSTRKELYEAKAFVASLLTGPNKEERP